MAIEPPSSDPAPGSLAWAHPIVQEWFLHRFGSPTEPQIVGWPAILRGEPTLLSAPTGSGKTLSAFLVAIDKLLRAAIIGRLEPRTYVIYLSPLKALSNDIQKNLQAPLAEIQQLSLARGFLSPEIRIGVRTGDTLAKDRAAMLRHPPHILVTTPESLYILLTAARSRQNLTHVQTVIVDEIHAIAGSKRGAHLALSLERLDALVCGENPLTPGARLTASANRPQRIGLSATQNPIQLLAGFLTGAPSASEPNCAPSQTPELIPELTPDQTPARQPATIIQVSHRRTLDLAIEVPSAELSSITSTAMWEEIYDKLAAFAQQHRSTLVFVNTRMQAEKISFELSNRLGEDAVAAHHGSLSRTLRLDAEQRLKSGQIRILVATASLELGIDIGAIDLVCQIGSTRSISIAMQRVGRAGHWRGAIPKGRFFALTRDDLLEQAALLRQMTTGELDRLEIPEAPIDVLMQQIVAAVGAEPWPEHALYHVLRRAWPYRSLTLHHFQELLSLLHSGIVSSRGRYGAYLLRDQVHGRLHPRRGARSIAISNGGAIPDVSIFTVLLQPENVPIATVGEHFAVESHPGDVIQLGNTSWRIQRVDPSGKLLVEDAHGAPPSIPFWEGEAPQRTAALSDAVSELRTQIDRLTRDLSPAGLPHAGLTPSSASTALAHTISLLQSECFLSDWAARQLITYIVHGRAVLGAVPSKSTLIAERFFDQGGGQQLILHAPFGGRLNKAWGLALRKRFCRGFNFELQAAATDNGINISLAEQHSFPLAEVFHFLSTLTARSLLEQACIPSPLFKNRWRWAVGRSLQLLRMQNGRRIAPQIQRIRSDDLLAAVFPHASACPENLSGDIEIPDHPLVREVMKDTLTEAMDIDGLLSLLQGISDGSITCIAVDTPVPSVFSHELLHAMPYAFLDPEDAAARRSRAVSTPRGALPSSLPEAPGRLDPAAIAKVRTQLWPDLRDEHELHDLLLQLIALPLPTLSQAPIGKGTEHWPLFFARLQAQGRAHAVSLDGQAAWVATEQIATALLLWPELETQLEAQPANRLGIQPAIQPETHSRPTTNSASATATPSGAAADAHLALTQGWLQILGPTTAAHLAAHTHLQPASILQALLTMEMQGLILRGIFERPCPFQNHPAQEATADTQWCERHILQRIHRLTLGTLRRQIAPVSPAFFFNWLLGWHLGEQAGGQTAEQSPRQPTPTESAGEEAVLAAIEQLEGFEAPAIEWERSLLPARVPHYSPQWLDNLCLAGVVAWGRLSPHPAWADPDPAAKPGSQSAPSPSRSSAPRRVIPTSLAPITFYLRDSSAWLDYVLASKSVDEATLMQSLSAEAQAIRSLLSTHGAAFAVDLQRLSGLTRLQTTTALWELATAGLASADGFDQLRAVMDPRRRSQAAAATGRAPSLRKSPSRRTTAGRWSLLPTAPEPQPVPQPVPSDAFAQARRKDAGLDAAARILLCRYGVLFRELLTREANAPRWGDLLPILRRLEARGEIRGGRFVSGPFGEQYALPEAVSSLRRARSKASLRPGQNAPLHHSAPSLLDDPAARPSSDEPAPTPQPILTLSAADPLNLIGILIPGERIPSIAGRTIRFCNGVLIAQDPPSEPTARAQRPGRSRSVSDLLRAASAPPRAPQSTPYPDLFS
ncbi:MAG: DEAD/DEAH box helicase [Acidobacteriaceae bacterium]